MVVRSVPVSGEWGRDSLWIRTLEPAGPRCLGFPAVAPFRPRLTQDWVAQQEASTSLFCLPELVSGTALRVRGPGGQGVTGS